MAVTPDSGLQRLLVGNAGFGPRGHCPTLAPRRAMGGPQFIARREDGPQTRAGAHGLQALLLADCGMEPLSLR